MLIRYAAKAQMYRHSIITAIAIATFTSGCDKSPANTTPAVPASEAAVANKAINAPAPPRQKRHLIDYGHLTEGVLYHCTISDLDGKPQATWTFELNGKKTTQSRQLSEEEFDSIWNGIIDSKVFKNCLVTDPEAKVDPVANHIVAVYYADGDSETLRNYSIPHTEDDSDFLQWLGLLKIPKGSL